MRKKRNLFGLFYIATVVFLCAVPSLCSAQEQKLALGELRIEGEHIEKLVLVHRNGHKETINLPSETIQLPVGEYRLQQVTLDELNISGLLMQFSGSDWITVSEDKPAVLKAGAPLNQTIEIKRQGSILVLNYKLRGLAGETYTDNQRSKPPGFTIYRGDKEIVSDKFSYG